MAAGLPVVAAAVGGIPDVVSDGVNGFLFTPGDTAALQRLVRRLILDRELSRCIATAAQETVRRRFAVDRVMEQLEEIYAGLGLARPPLGTEANQGVGDGSVPGPANLKGIGYG